MREDEHTGEYLWLRQTVTVTANGQTRTLEMAIPVRLGATPQEVAALRAQATTGMAQLSQALDEALATALAPEHLGIAHTGIGSVSTAPVTPAPPSAPPATTSSATTPTLRESALAPVASEPSQPTDSSAARTTTPAPPPAAVSSPAPSPRPTPAASVLATPSRPSTPAPSRPATVPAAAPTSSLVTPAGPMSRQEFLSAASQLGLNPKQAMERLGVRTLEGLNLGEALEALRRQMLRGDDSGVAPNPAPTAPSRTASAQPSSPPTARTASTSPVAPRATPSAGQAASRPAPSSPPATAARAAFDEEVETDFTYHLGEAGLDDELDGDEPGAALDNGDYADGGLAPATEDFGELGELGDLADLDDEDDVPDFGPPASRAASAPSRPATSRGSSATRTAATSPAPSPRGESNPNGANPGTTNVQAHALEMIRRMRTAPAGGSGSEHQWKAYHNIVVGQLSESEARMLIQGLWRVQPEKLGADQLDELLSWGKRDDDFPENARLVLAALEAERKAERERARNATGTTGASGGGATVVNSSTPSPTSPRPRTRTVKRESDDPAGGESAGGTR